MPLRHTWSSVERGGFDPPTDAEPEVSDAGSSGWRESEEGGSGPRVSPGPGDDGAGGRWRVAEKGAGAGGGDGGGPDGRGGAPSLSKPGIPPGVPVPDSARPSVLSKMQKWADYESVGRPVRPSLFLPMKTPMSGEILDSWSLPRGPAHPLTVPVLLEEARRLSLRVSLIVDLAAHECLYREDLPTDGSIEHVQVPLEAKVVPSREAVARVADAAERHWARHPDDAVAIHCAYGFNRTGFVVCSYLCSRRGLSPDEALAAFAQARPPGVKHEKFVEELWRRYGGDDGQLRRDRYAQLLAGARASGAGAGGSADASGHAAPEGRGAGGEQAAPSPRGPEPPRTIPTPTLVTAADVMARLAGSSAADALGCATSVGEAAGRSPDPPASPRPASSGAGGSPEAPWAASAAGPPAAPPSPLPPITEEGSGEGAPRPGAPPTGPDPGAPGDRPAPLERPSSLGPSRWASTPPSRLGRGDDATASVRTARGGELGRGDAGPSGHPLAPPGTPLDIPCGTPPASPAASPPATMRRSQPPLPGSSPGRSPVGLGSSPRPGPAVPGWPPAHLEHHPESSRLSSMHSVPSMDSEHHSLGFGTREALRHLRESALERVGGKDGLRGLFLDTEEAEALASAGRVAEAPLGSTPGPDGLGVSLEAPAAAPPPPAAADPETVSSRPRSPPRDVRTRGARPAPVPAGPRAAPPPVAPPLSPRHAAAPPALDGRRRRACGIM